jgi:hypothetical protein
MSKVFEKYHNWNYKNTSLFVVSLVLLYFLADVSWFKSAINYIGLWGYFGAFIVGIFFVSIFTVAPAILVLYSLVAKLNPLGIAAFAGLGAVVGDYVIFRFFRDRVFEELRPLAGKFKTTRLIGRMFQTPFFSWIPPFVGAFIIASPFPDEVGIGMMGLSKVRSWQFLVISYLLNSAGILFIAVLARSIH